MASASSTTPPKFVPTLTEEVDLPADAQMAEALLAPAEVPGGYELPAGVDDDDELPPPSPESGETPESATVLESDDAEVLSPTTQMTQEPGDARAPSVQAPSLPQTVITAQPVPLPDGYEEYVVHRVMQRVDVMLEQRLRDAIAQVIQEQTRSIVPRLREEVESVVRQSVYEAVADELASTQGSR
ncbi:hypothetical protein [Diaphorobacter aerolatus]|uniref:DUF2486 family protein n=1 Tax=Diaphorobacter aerolatus TaxID=1288495 RepID=A0A7H0GKL2_9BURK|nr:hypothetical protein [Diaphorobacter aerolatus]QNP48828.1 hypothetical protein H9K75_00990 [Diaphorobacter aerolatus]